MGGLAVKRFDVKTVNQDRIVELLARELCEKSVRREEGVKEFDVLPSSVDQKITDRVEREYFAFIPDAEDWSARMLAGRTIAPSPYHKLPLQSRMERYEQALESWKRMKLAERQRVERWEIRGDSKLQSFQVWDGEMSALSKEIEHREAGHASTH